MNPKYFYSKLLNYEIFYKPFQIVQILFFPPLTFVSRTPVEKRCSNLYQSSISFRWPFCVPHATVFYAANGAFKASNVDCKPLTIWIHLYNIISILRVILIIVRYLQCSKGPKKYNKTSKPRIYQPITAKQRAFKILQTKMLDGKRQFFYA